MNQEKIGNFIQEARKKKKLTQQQLAEKLNVTDRSVSNWENGKNMPDLSLFKPICDELDITINELMSGEKLSESEYGEKLEENIINVVSKVEKRNKTYLKTRYIFMGVLAIIIWYFLCLFLVNINFLKQDYDKDRMYITQDEEIFDGNLNFVYEDECPGFDMSYLVTSFKDDTENKIIFVNVKCSLKGVYLKKKDSSERTDLTIHTTRSLKRLPYNSENVFYTKVDFDKIRKADDKELRNIISKSFRLEKKSIDE